MLHPLLQFTHVSKSFPIGEKTIEILHDLNFTIKKGEFISIIGPSGSGKSTIMNILGFLDVPTTGSYLLEGSNTSELTPNELADIRAHKIGFIFQSFNLLSQKSVFDNVQLPLLYRRDIPITERKRRVADALQAAQLDESIWYKKTNVISGGQRQRAAIARALVGGPSIILADEPTGNLDSKTGILVLEELTRLNRELGITVIIITHDTKVARTTDRAITIVDGAITSDVYHTV